MGTEHLMWSTTVFGLEVSSNPSIGNTVCIGHTVCYSMKLSK